MSCVRSLYHLSTHVEIVCSRRKQPFISGVVCTFQLYPTANVGFLGIPIIESPDHVDHETQCGFRSRRGTCDGSFTVKQLIKKRREHGLETWMLLIDLVIKAFDRVPSA